jgi:predicted Zn-dependent protease
MGHEIAHAVAKHGNERMSQQMAVAGIASVATMSQSENSQANSIFDLVFRGTTTLGMLKFSRVHETESDKMGLVFMKLAGYDPYQAISFWEKMAQNGAKVPEILSTHPSDQTRINDIDDFIKNDLDRYVN